MRFKDLPGQSCPVCNGSDANEKQNHPLHWTFAVQERKATQTGAEHNAEFLRGKDVAPEPNLAQLQAAIALLRRFLFAFCEGEALRLFSAGRAFLHIISALTVSHSPYSRLSLADSQRFRRLGEGYTRMPFAGRQTPNRITLSMRPGRSMNIAAPAEPD